jgi:hypothetical protein
MISNWWCRASDIHTCLQWNQIAAKVLATPGRDYSECKSLHFVSSVILMVKCFAAVNPESKPAEEFPEAARYVQGLVNDDCVTECATVVLRYCQFPSASQRKDLLTRGTRK